MPRHRKRDAWLLGTFVSCLWLSRLVTTPEYFERTLQLGHYHPESDSIAIPIAGNVAVTILGFPVVLVLLSLLFRRFPQRLSLHAWSKARPVASALWTGLFLVLAIFEAEHLFGCIRLRLPLSCATTLGWIFAWRCLRAVVVSRLDEPTSTGAP